jgi:light-harvesting complex 1 alpha chain
MAEIQRPKNPEDDWKVWLVLNPATWLVPILMAVLAIGIAIHAFLFTVSPYGSYWGG